MVVSEDLFSSTVTVCDPSPMFALLRIVFSLVPFPSKGHPVNSHIPKNKVSRGQDKEQIFVVKEFTEN